MLSRSNSVSTHPAQVQRQGILNRCSNLNQNPEAVETLVVEIAAQS